jgi:protein-disulfide isomerase
MTFSGSCRGVALASLVALAVTACTESSSAAGQALPAPASNPDQVVAEVGGRSITLKEVDAKWEEFDAAERARVTQLLYQNRRNMLEQVVGEIVIENAAKAANLSVQAYLAQDSAKRATPVTEAEIVQFFEANRDRTQGRTLEQLRGQIKEFLEGQRTQQARAQLVEELKAKGAAVKVMLDPPRYTVAVAANDPVRGVDTAPVTIVEFSDYQCPFCARVNPTLEQVRKTYGDKVKIVFKDFPLPNHPQAPKASEAGHCANEQGKYWELHDLMFANQRALNVPELKQYATTLGLDMTKFNQCLDSGKHAGLVAAGMAQGEKMGVNSTPTLYINGRALIGAQPFEAFKAIIDEELARK